ncbi:MAG: adenosylcobinamide-GDP ribazoletransferase [Chloroflexi bacterium]|nr:adenosylcobinamide-GDP ribazoletransferase [Chloroflexota bacterium]
MAKSILKSYRELPALPRIFREECYRLLTAVQFLTILPPFLQREVSVATLGRSLAYFPIVGLLLGLILAGLDALLQLAFPPTIVNALLVVSLVWLTGALHLDGLMDACDGLFSHKEAPQMLDIMRDSRVGGFGVVGAISILLLKYASLSALPADFRLGGLILMATLGRWAMSYAIWAFPYARSQGKGTPFKGQASRGQALLATLLTTLVVGWFLQVWGIALLIFIWLSTWLLAKYIMTKIPGLTGDTYGAINEVTEAITLLLLVAGRTMNP